MSDFLRPITNAMRSQFLTTRAAARHMTARGAGVVLAFGGGPVDSTHPALLLRTATLSDVGATAAFAASDKARTITSTDIDISCGAIVN
ncbi:hypothetical protein AB0O76_40395 [Streptomyces sp. NPDC086554]|uniref:hypothetical protein n=1 Tax=Streptomyces sp. NPDC086554 TaxID=3154864 RepID=UPI003432D405